MNKIIICIIVILLYLVFVQLYGFGMATVLFLFWMSIISVS